MLGKLKSVKMMNLVAHVVITGQYDRKFCVDTMLLQGLNEEFIV